MSLDGRLDVVVTDDTVEFSFTVQTTGTEPVALEFRSGKIADVAVTADGAEVWRWSADRLFTQSVRTEKLAPGESFTREMTWADPSPGEYTATATLEAANATLEERASFEVP